MMGTWDTGTRLVQSPRRVVKELLHLYDRVEIFLSFMPDLIVHAVLLAEPARHRHGLRIQFGAACSYTDACIGGLRTFLPSALHLLRFVLVAENATSA